jgi:hypothetical protein
MDTLTTQQTQTQSALSVTPLILAKRKRLVGQWIEVDGRLTLQWMMVEDCG